VGFCGIGNIAGCIVTPERQHQMVSLSGIAGHQAARLKEFEYGWSTNSIIVLHSDGVSARWQLSSYPGLAVRKSSIIAAALFRDLRKPTDDASVIVGKQR
jgi:hypothetical protein